MADKTIIKINEEPIIIRMSKQGMAGRPGPAGVKGDDGTSWELSLVMEGSDDGTCLMRLYKDGILCTQETHYAYVQLLYVDGTNFVPVEELCSSFSGTYSFEYTNTQAIFVTVFDDSFMQKVICSKSINYGKSATISVGNVQTGASASVTNVGTALDAEFDFVLPKGDSGTVSIGTVQTGAPGTNASVVNSGTPNDAILDFVLPRGNDGDGYMGAQYDSAQEGVVFETTQNMLSDMAFEADVQSNSKEYVRKNGAWVESNISADYDSSTECLTLTL